MAHPLPHRARFDIDVEHSNGEVHVSPRGELDLVTAPRLRTALNDVTERGATVVIDLRDLDFIDSTGLRLLWEANERAVKAGMDLEMISGQPPVMKLFELTGLTRRLPFRD